MEDRQGLMIVYTNNVLAENNWLASSPMVDDFQVYLLETTFGASQYGEYWKTIKVR